MTLEHLRTQLTALRRAQFGSRARIIRFRSSIKGISLAAIQGLKAKNQALKQKNQALERMYKALEDRLDTLEQTVNP